MNTLKSDLKRLLTVAILSALLVACTGIPPSPEGAVAARNKLTRLQSDPQLASRAPVAIKDAEAAVVIAEKPERDEDLANHLVFMADRKVEIAWSKGKSRLLRDERKTLSEKRESARLESRTHDGNPARAQSADLQR